jgi:hypothetical protein
MRVGESFGWRRELPRDSLRAACCLLLLPLIATVLTAGFLGYAAWRLVYLLWQLICLTCRYIARTSARATTYT